MADIDKQDAETAIALVTKAVLAGVSMPTLTDEEKAAARALAEKYASTKMDACPFCGRADTLRASGPDGAVGCDNCGAIGPNPAFNPDLVAGWNTRTPPAS